MQREVLGKNEDRDIATLHQGRRCLDPTPYGQHFRKGPFTLRESQNEMINASGKGCCLPYVPDLSPDPFSLLNTHSHREPLNSMQAVG